MTDLSYASRPCRRALRLLCAGALLLATSPAFAQDVVDSLTEDNVRSFIETTTAVMSGDRQMSEDELLEYLQNHLDERGIFKSLIRYNVPGFPSQETTMSLDRQQYIDNVTAGQKSLENYTTQVTVGAIRISQDGRKAVVQTSSHEQGTMPVEQEKGKQEMVPVEGSSTCTQTLVLGSENHIRMYSADCKTDITFQQAF